MLAGTVLKGSTARCRPLVAQFLSSQLSPVVFNDPGIGFSFSSTNTTCPLCGVQFNSNTVEEKSEADAGKMKNDFDPFLDCNEEPKFAPNDIVVHPLLLFNCCYACQQRLLAIQEYPHDACACCGYVRGNIDEKERTFAGCCRCALNICSACMVHKLIRVWFAAYSACCRCYNDSKVEEQKRAILDDLNKIQGNKHLKFEKRRNVIRELEDGERIWPAISTKEKEKKISEFVDKEEIDFTDDIFSNKVYRHENNVVIVEKDVSKGAESFPIPLYMESYFQELLLKMKSDSSAIDGDNLNFNIKSDYLFNFPNFEYGTTNKLDDSVKAKFSDHNIIQKLRKFESSIELRTNLRILVEGKSGAYIVTCNKDLVEGDIVGELVGEVKSLPGPGYVVEENEFGSKCLILEKDMMVDFLRFGNFSHFINIIKEKGKANLAAELCVDPTIKSSHPSTTVRIALIASKNIVSGTALYLLQES